MSPVRTITLNTSVLADNDLDAEDLRAWLKRKGTLLVNLMSSPGAGKTTFLEALIPRLAQRLRIGVLEADIDGDVDAVRMDRTGVRAIQLHTGGMCHLDAAMTRQGLMELGVDDFDLIVLENVGNLVCPAEYDTGAGLDVVLTSVPEGDDKPLKYPLIFEKCSLVLITKIDTESYFPFDLARCEQNIRRRNPEARIIAVSAKTGEHMDEAAAWFEQAVAKWKGNEDA